MTMTDWFLAELESEAVKSRHVLEQVPAGKGDWKPHERSMAFGYLSNLVANIPSWVGMAITLDELDIAPKDGPKHAPAPLNTTRSSLRPSTRRLPRRAKRCRKPTTRTSRRPGDFSPAANSPSNCPVTTSFAIRSCTPRITAGR